MKKLVALLLLCSSLQAFGQLTLVRETKNKFVPFRLSTSEWMLFSETKVSSKMQSVTIYNKDYSIYKVIQIPQTFPYDTVGFKNSINIVTVGLIRDDDDPDGTLVVSDKFFNNDSKLEILIGYNSYLTKDNKTIRKSSILIINEDGLEIAKISNPDGDLRLTFWGYLDVDYIDYNNPSNEIINTKIYSVPGNLPCSSSCSQKSASIAPITQTNEFKEIQVTGFPNPSSEKVTLAYTLPEGTPFGTLRLYTQTGELVKEFKVSNQVDHLELPVSEYNSGTYFYELQAGGSSSGGKKMVVIH